MNNDWYKKIVFYQIWIRSFFDGNGDGIGDLYGVYEKLDYIKSLGIGGIWFSPLYPSPNADFGYDISDYCDIHPDYGDLEQFKKVLDHAHALGMKVIMDLVVNHTSNEHPWFIESRKGKDNPYSDYYIWRDKPNNWDSIFEGKAWEYDEERKQYYLHLFSKKQPDLNMDNPAVREEVKKILRFWLDMGVDGFREDVITFISKKEGLPNGLPFIPVINGMPHYKDGPRIHEFMNEFRSVCSDYNCVQIGEGPMTTVKSAMKYISGPEKTLDMMISFDHMMANCFYTEYLHRPFSLVKLKKAFSKWQYTLSGKAWCLLYLENHDHPRIISRYGSKRFWKESGKMLAVSYLFQQGTPFIYQGQEIGMTNIRLSSIDQYVDISSKNNFHKYHLKDDIKKRLQRIHISSRDSSRTPVQWSAEKFAGFSKVKPWFHLNSNYPFVNVESEEKDPDSILNFYRKCVSIRNHSKTLLFGTYQEYFPKNRHFYIYERILGSNAYLIICSFSRHTKKIRLPVKFRLNSFSSGIVLSDKPKYAKMKLILCNYTDSSDNELLFRPFEARVYQFKFVT